MLFVIFFINHWKVISMKSAPKYSVVAAGVLLSLASLSAHAVEIKVIPKGPSIPSSMGVNSGVIACEENSGRSAAHAIVQENGGNRSAISFGSVTSAGLAGSSVKLVSVSENDPVSLSRPGCRYITVAVDTDNVQDGEYDLSKPDSAVKVEYVQVFTDAPGLPDATIVATYAAEQGRAYVVYDKVADQLSATFDFATTVEPLPPQWGVGYSSVYPVSITSGSVVSKVADFPSCFAAWEASSARNTCEAGNVTGSLKCQVNTRCFNKVTGRFQDASASGFRNEIGSLNNCNGVLSRC
jgi:hypothetical protein